MWYVQKFGINHHHHHDLIGHTEYFETPQSFLSDALEMLMK